MCVTEIRNKEAYIVDMVDYKLIKLRISAFAVCAEQSRDRCHVIALNNGR
jgi:hypothetical protein